MSQEFRNSELNYYFEKFYSKMNGWCVEDVAGWVAGIGYDKSFNDTLTKRIMKAGSVVNGYIYYKG